MAKNKLYIIAAAIWGIPGLVITCKGIGAYVNQPLRHLWWLLLITAGVLAFFFFIFRRIVDNYSARIASLPDTSCATQAFPLRGWILIGCMLCLGIALRFIPGIPAAFTASFYSGLGPMLLWSACRFIRNRKQL